MPYDTWPCKKDWFFHDIDEVPDPDFSYLLEGSYFTLFVGGSTLYGIVTPPDATDSSFHCQIFSDSARTQEITTGDYTGETYRMEFFGGWIFENRNRFNERDFSGAGRWVSNPVTIYANGGYFIGKWIVLDYIEASVNLFEGDWYPNAIGIYDLSLSETVGGLLPAGTYTVHVSGVDSQGREGGASYETITVSSDSKILATWRPNAQAVTYNVYRDCQLFASGVVDTDISIGDLILEDPGTSPPPKSDPTIPPDDDAPTIVILPPDNPDELPGGKIIGTDPETGNDYTIVVTPGVPVDPNLTGKVIVIRTEQVGDCLETKTYTDGELTAWTKLCTDPVTGEQTYCVGRKLGEATEVNYPINQIFPAVPYPVTTNAEQDDVFNFSLAPAPSPPAALEWPLDINGDIVYVDDQLNQIDPDAENSEGEISVRILGGSLNQFTVGDQEPPSFPAPGGWATESFLDPFEQAATTLQIESVSTGDPADLPGTEWYLQLSVSVENWEFLCEATEDAQEPTVGSCQSTTTVQDTFDVAGVSYGTRIDTVQCSDDPVNQTWSDLSYLPEILLKLFGAGGPIPRASTRQDRSVARDRQDEHDPRLWLYPLTGNPQRYLESLWLHEKLNASDIPSQMRAVSAFGAL